LATGVILGFGILIGGLMFGCSSGGDSDNGPDPPDTAAEFTQRGWQRFQAGNLSGALADFTDAIDLDATYGPAYVGQGWARLGLATTAAAMQSAVTNFDSAITNGEDGAIVRSGRAAANLGAGGTSLAAAISDAQTARTADPSFVFPRRTSFTVDDLYLIEAFAHVAQAQFTEALAAADAVEDSGIEEGNSSSWVVDSVTYSSFNGAVMAYLHQLSTDHAG
jgi:hypothetical protein